jgi:hypothetical protein
VAIRNCVKYVFVALAAGALASCSGPSPSPLTPAAGPSIARTGVEAATHARLYVAWTDNNGMGSRIRVYDAPVGAHPKLLETLRSPYDEIRGITIDAQGNLYAAACTSCDDGDTSALVPADASSASNGIAVYREGRGEPRLDYIAPAGELPVRVVVGSDGTVYSGNALSLRSGSNGRWRLTVEVYANGRKPVRTIVVAAKAGYRNFGLALDAHGNLWASYVLAMDVNTDIKAHVRLAEYAPHSSAAQKTYVLPHLYDYSDGGLAFDNAGHLVIATCLTPDTGRYPCGALVLDVSSMRKVAFLLALSGCQNQLCFSPFGFALNADGSELWATTTKGGASGGAAAYTYPTGQKTAYLHTLRELTYGVAFGPPQ